jgi:hypothetical protein
VGATDRKQSLTESDGGALRTPRTLAENLREELRSGSAVAGLVCAATPGNLLKLRGISADGFGDVVDTERLLRRDHAIEFPEQVQKRIMELAFQVFLGGQFFDYIAPNSIKIDQEKLLLGEAARILGADKWESMSREDKFVFARAVRIGSYLPVKEEVAEVLNKALFDVFVAYASATNSVFRGIHFETKEARDSYVEKLEKSGLFPDPAMLGGTHFSSKKARDDYAEWLKSLYAAADTEELRATVFRPIAEAFAMGRGYGIVVRVDLSKISCFPHLYFGKNGESEGFHRFEGEVEILGGVPKGALVEITLVENPKYQHLTEKIKQAIKGLYQELDEKLKTSPREVLESYAEIHMTEVVEYMQARYGLEVSRSDVVKAAEELRKERYLKDTPENKKYSYIERKK